MRCWHKDLIPFLPRLQLLGQWRECCLIAKSIAEKGTPNHILVNRVLDYPVQHFIIYADNVTAEMERRGYKISFKAVDTFNANVNKTRNIFKLNDITDAVESFEGDMFYGWHNDTYLRQCLYNLEEKAICGGISKDEWKRIYDEFKDFTPLWCGQ